MDLSRTTNDYFSRLIINLLGKFISQCLINED